MWCSVCQSDVATEVGADNRRVSCSNCGHLLGGAAGAMPNHPPAGVAPPSGPETRAEEARQLLDRWAKGHFFDPYGPPKKTGIARDTSAARESSVAAATEAVSPENGPRPEVRPVAATVMQGAGNSPAPAPFSTEDLRNRETIDERTFIDHPPQIDLKPEPSVFEPTAKQVRVTSADASSADEDATEKAGAVENDSEVVARASDAAQAASSAELDRLTREIMARVSKITEARTATNIPTADGESAHESSTGMASDEPVTFAAGLAASFPDPATPARGNEHRDRNDRSTHTAPTGFDEPVPSRAGVSRRMDATHQAVQNSEPAMAAAARNQTPTEPESGGWYNNIGQILAYLGIICLTAGTCGVIVSYFGGPANYAPYGWLGATIGQMLLFLGIVTLISAGMEQTSQELRQAVDQRMGEVTQRLDQIGTRIMRIEEANLDGPRKPHMLSHADQERSRTSRQMTESTRHDG
jgi:hypothetical protein